MAPQKKRTIIRWLILSAGLMAPAVFATPYYVSTNGNDSSNGLSWASAKATPGGGVAAATNDGDEVIVSNGTYVLAAPLSINKSITLRSMNNNYSTVVFDGGGTNRQIAINAAAANALVAGITMSNSANSGDGGGFYINAAANATISNCLVTRCSSGGRGGGVRMTSGRLVNCVISSNSAATYGGGVDNITGAILLRGCVISNNTAPSGGAGLMFQTSATNEVEACVFWGNGPTEALQLYAGAVAIVRGCEFRDNAGLALTGDSAPLVTNCTFVGNLGGGISLNSSPALIVNCTFTNNRSGSGGAITLRAGQNVERCVLLHNYASASGGGIHMLGGVVRNSLIAGNEAGIGGGIRAITSAQGAIENCTIVGNKATDGSYGAGGIMFQSSGAGVTNTICLFNTGGSSSISNYYTLSAPMVFGYSCTAPAPTAGADGGGNVTQNPLFLYAGADFGTNYVLGNLKLQQKSPCRNTGLNMPWMLNATDLPGKLRIQEQIVDMGAYEVLARGAVLSMH